MGSPPQLDHISIPRWRTYLSYAKGNHQLALDLYEWNLRAAAATHTVLSVVEVALRNAIDRSLRVWNPVSEWTLDPGPVLCNLCDDDLTRAKKHAKTL